MNGGAKVGSAPPGEREVFAAAGAVVVAEANDERAWALFVAAVNAARTRLAGADQGS